MTPIPQPSEIVAFIIRGFSRVDHQNNPSLKKKLQRLSKDAPLSINAATKLLSETLDDFLNACPNRDQTLYGIGHYLSTYLNCVTNLDCGALPPAEVRRIFDQFAVAMFAAHLQPALAKFRIAPTDVIGRPDEGISTIWQANLKGRTVSDLASDLSRKISKQEGTWEKEIRRWVDGQGMNVSTIMAITTKVDFDLGYALLLANAYREYCRFSPVDVLKHTPPFDFSPEKIQQDIVVLHNGPSSHFGALDAGTKQQVQRLMRLSDPRRRKQVGDPAEAETCIQVIKETLKGEERLAGFAFVEGLHQAQLGNLETALGHFEQASEWFRFRSRSQLQDSLHHLLNTSAALGKKRLRNHWKVWCEALGLDVLPQSTARAFLRDFPHPYEEAQNWPSLPTHDGDIVILSEWEVRAPDLRNPDRVVKGYGKIPSPQLQIFAHLGQSEKVSALLQHGANPNKLDRSSVSALLKAIRGGDSNCVKELLKVTSPDTVNTKANDGKSCLHEAIMARNPDWVISLIDGGANVQIEGERGQSPLHTAVSLFISNGAISQAFANPQQYRAFQTQIPESIRPTSSPFAADQGEIFDILATTLPGLKAEFISHSAESFGDIEIHRNIVEILLNSGADVNAKVAPQGWTPFLYAAEIGNPWLFKTLIKQGASVCDQLSDGHTAYSLLHGYGHTELAQWFLKAVSIEDRLWLRENGPKHRRPH